MKWLAWFVLTLPLTLFVSLLIASAVIGSAEEKPVLSELQTLKAKNYQFRASTLSQRFEGEKAQAVQAISKKYQDEVQSLETERVKLEADYTTTLHCDAGFDWQSLTCLKKSLPKETK